jgi:hypothetical protein
VVAKHPYQRTLNCKCFLREVSDLALRPRPRKVRKVGAEDRVSEARPSWPEATLQASLFVTLSEGGHNRGLRKPAWNQGCTSRLRRDVSTLRTAEGLPNCVRQHATPGARLSAPMPSQDQPVSMASEVGASAALPRSSGPACLVVWEGTVGQTRRPLSRSSDKSRKNHLHQHATRASWRISAIVE